MEKNVFLALFRDNSDGEGYIYPTIVRMENGEILHYDTGRPLIEYRGDEILGLWQPSELNEYRKHIKDGEWRSVGRPPKDKNNIDVLLKDNMGHVLYGVYNSNTYEFYCPNNEHFQAEYWQHIGEP